MGCIRVANLHGIPAIAPAFTGQPIGNLRREFAEVPPLSVIFFHQSNNDAEVRCGEKYAGLERTPKNTPLYAKLVVRIGYRPVNRQSHDVGILTDKETVKLPSAAQNPDKTIRCRSDVVCLLERKCSSRTLREDATVSGDAERTRL